MQDIIRQSEDITAPGGLAEVKRSFQHVAILSHAALHILVYVLCAHV